MNYTFYTPQAINEIGARKNQQDTIYPAPGKATADSRVFIVCDGMGGYEKGEVASMAVATAMGNDISEHCDLNQPFTDQLFTAALNAAYDALDNAGKQEPQMGTTLTMLCFHNGGCTAAHIGDSRIYHLRPDTGEILFRSRDHSLVQQLYDMGEITYEEMRTSPKRNIIIRAMQPRQDERSKADLVLITDIRPGDYFYMCTDGMLEKMEDETLMAILADKQTDDNQKRQQLVRLTAENSDNHSAYLIHIKDVEGQEAPKPGITVKKTSPKTTGKATKWLIPLVILLVAIITGFTIYNMMTSKKDTPVKTEVTVPDDPNRVKYMKDDAAPGHHPSSEPVRRNSRPTATVEDRQTKEVNNLLEDAKRRDANKAEADKQKAGNAGSEQPERQTIPTQP